MWFDALCNYLTIAKHSHDQLSTALWSNAVHLVGKDILRYPKYSCVIKIVLFRFHAVYWPAFLMAADLPPPKQVVSHAHWTVGRVKVQ